MVLIKHKSSYTKNYDYKKVCLLATCSNLRQMKNALLENLDNKLQDATDMNNITSIYDKFDNLGAVTFSQLT